MHLDHDPAAPAAEPAPAPPAQLAKAALYAGARLLLDRYGVASPDRITLAGAFGSHIDVKYAMILGLIVLLAVLVKVSGA